MMRRPRFRKLLPMTMTLSRTLKITAALTLAALCVGRLALATAAEPPAAPAGLCTVDGKAYSAGAVVEYRGAHYRCMAVRVGAIESPPTLAWQDDKLP